MSRTRMILYQEAKLAIYKLFDSESNSLMETRMLLNNLLAEITTLTDVLHDETAPENMKTVVM